MTKPAAYAWPSDPASPHPSGVVPATGRPPFRRLKSVLAVLAVLAVVAVGGAGIVAMAVADQFSSQYPASFSAPNRIATLVRTRSPKLLRTEANARADLRRDGYAEPFSAIYESATATPRVVAVGGATERILVPRWAVDSAFASERRSGARLADVRGVDDPGAIGGVLRCGTEAVNRRTAVFCVWADHGSFGVCVFFGTTITEAADLLLTIRDSVIVRG